MQRTLGDFFDSPRGRSRLNIETGGGEGGVHAELADTMLRTKPAKIAELCFRDLVVQYFFHQQSPYIASSITSMEAGSVGGIQRHEKPWMEIACSECIG